MAHIKSFGDLGGGNSDSEEDDRGGMNDYYAGGEKSGQLIRGAPKDPEEDKDRVSNLFDKARKAGAVQGTGDDLEAKPGAFRGVGRNLKGEEASAPQEGPTVHVITFYRNGIFTVNNGPARRVDDPANFKFIDSISKGECPEELDTGRLGAEVTVNLVRQDEDYKEPEKPKYTAFQGMGRTLAGPSEASTSADAAAAVAAAAAASSTQVEWEGVDESKPVTSLQLRLADGSRMVAKFNHTHTIADIRRFIRASRPDITWPYQLMTAFPSAVIGDEARSLQEAGLLAAVVIQKKL